MKSRKFVQVDICCALFNLYLHRERERERCFNGGRGF